MVKIKNNQLEKKIYVRIPTSKFFLDKRLTHQALTPNTIHAYDASVIFLCLKICRDLGINILVIHDCIGCNLIYAPIVKKIFKIANIEILKMSAKKAPFPLKKKIISEENFEELKIKILESTNFFR
jgi:DNA-directed RNA polymerase